MNKVFLIQAHYEYGIDDFFITRVASTFERAKEIFKELVNEELSTLYATPEHYCVNEKDMEELNFEEWDGDNLSHIWIEEKEIEE